MTLLLTFLLGAYVTGLRAGRPGGRLATWPLVAASVVVAAGYYSLRVISG